MERGLPELLPVDIAEHHIGFSRPALKAIADLPDIQAGTDAQDTVRILHTEIPRAVSPPAGAARIERVLRRDDIRRIPADDDGNLQAILQLQEVGLRPGDPDAISRIEDRSPALPKLIQDMGRRFSQLLPGRDRKLLPRCPPILRKALRIFEGGEAAEQFFPLLLRRKVSLHRGRRLRVRMPLPFRIPPAVLSALIALPAKAPELLRLDIAALYIHRDIQPAGAGPSGLREIDALFQGIPHPVGVQQKLRILRHAGDRPCDLKLLVSHRAEPASAPMRRIVPSDLSADDEHRDGVQPGAEHAGDRIRPTGAGGHTHERRTIVDPRIALRRHGTGLFMVLIERMHPPLMPEGII